ncbi:MAG: alpha-D-ribose 1-methylphosphonate 5-triphosphate diphosphatase [Burkholderiales bacterium]|nr:MAG: alpha-D-ribose 1-methylphosphonate 5-triphosphate diphosphatase [Burkholderiales bacterium]
MSDETVFANALIVAADEAFVGHVVVAGGTIRTVGRGATATPGAIDLGGDWLLPGFVEVHTDNLEKHMLPRPGVLWDAYAATVVHDAQCAGAGITTVLDAVVIGSRDLGGGRSLMQDTAIECLQRCREDGVLRVEHLLHLRCELATADVLERFMLNVDRPDLRLVSVMDHTPGQRQWRDLARYRQYMERNGRYTEERFSAMLAEQHLEHEAHADANRRAVVEAARARGVPVASHDDTEVRHVEQARDEGIVMSEFPTTVEAARAAREAGMSIVMGGPNLVRGGSHSGNVSAGELARLGLLDIVSSDYVPSSLLMSVLRLRADGWSLPSAVGTVSRAPALSVGLPDRGEIAPGRRADLIHVRPRGAQAAVMQTWVAGRRVA